MSLLPGHWYYNTESGELTQGNNLENLGNNLVGGAGWHELNIPGNATEAQAAAEAKKEFPDGKPPTSSLGQGAAQELQTETGISNPLDFLSEIGDLFHRLTEAATWIRFAKILAGGALIIAGVLKLTGAEKTASALAKKVPIVPV